MTTHVKKPAKKVLKKVTKSVDFEPGKVAILISIVAAVSLVMFAIIALSMN